MKTKKWKEKTAQACPQVKGFFFFISGNEGSQLVSTPKSENNETIENKLRVSSSPKNIQLTKFFPASDKLGASLSADVDLGGMKSYKTGKNAILNEKLVRLVKTQSI